MRNSKETVNSVKSSAIKYLKLFGLDVQEYSYNNEVKSILKKIYFVLHINQIDIENIEFKVKWRNFYWDDQRHLNHKFDIENIGFYYLKFYLGSLVTTTLAFQHIFIMHYLIKYLNYQKISQLRTLTILNMQLPNEIFHSVFQEKFVKRAKNY